MLNLYYAVLAHYGACCSDSPVVGWAALIHFLFRGVREFNVGKWAASLKCVIANWVWHILYWHHHALQFCAALECLTSNVVFQAWEKHRLKLGLILHCVVFNSLCECVNKFPRQWLSRFDSRYVVDRSSINSTGCVVEFVRFEIPNSKSCPIAYLTVKAYHVALVGNALSYLDG